MSRRWRWTFQHGHSAWREDGNYSPQLNSETLAPVLRELAPGAEFVVGMSLGGLTAIRLAAMAPDLVGELVLVDVTPSALQRHAELTAEQRGTVALMHGEREFPSGGSSGFVTDQDTAELHRRATHFRGVHIVEKSGHSVQSDQPRALIEIVRGVLDTR